MKTEVTIIVENEIGNPSQDDIKKFINEILEKGYNGMFDLYKIVPSSGLSLRITNVKRLENNQNK